VLDAGVQLRREANESDRVYGNDSTMGSARTRSTVEPYAQLTLGGARWSVVPGLRLTADDQWGTHFTPRVAALYRPVEPIAVRAAVGRGFRAPDFKELYLWFPHVSSEFSYVVRGNPALRPETNDNVSGSVEWAGARAYLRADAYYNRFRDFIESRVVGDTTLAGAPVQATYYTYGNVGRGITRGVDLEGSLRVRGLRLEGGYGLLDAYDAESGDALLGRPRHSARLALSGSPRRGLSATVGGVYTGRTPVTVGDDGVQASRDGYLRLNARAAQTLGWRRGGQWTLEVGAQNLLDTRPELWPGFTGRQVYTGLSWQAGSAITAR
jgi:outer membrane receptor for ferrienterochelin and colicins